MLVRTNFETSAVVISGSDPGGAGDLQNVGYELEDCYLRNRCNLTATRTDSKSFSFENGLMR